MLILTRRPQEGLIIGDDIHVRVLAVRGNQVRIGITAPDEVTILRDELIEDPSVLENMLGSTTKAG